MHTRDDLTRARYALLRSYRADGTPVDTPIWFAIDGDALVFRTKIGPKTQRLTRDPRVEVRVCDHRGRVTGDETVFSGHAGLLDSATAATANELLRARYGWQYNVVPLLKIPGVRNVHSGLPLREKLRRARDRGLWPDSAIVRIEF